VTRQLLRRRLSFIEIILLIAAFLLFFQITDFKEIGYAVGVVAGIGILALIFFKPRYGLIAALAFAFIESTVNTINALADAAVEYDLTGLPPLTNTIWFAWGVQIVYITLLLAYFVREFLSGRKIEPLSRLELVLLVPLFAVLLYLPISLLLGNDMMLYSMDILPMCIYGGIVILARVMSTEKDQRMARYFLLDWFIVINILILIPLWVYNIAFDPWRNGFVGIAAIRSGVGPYDLNFYVAPLLGMILTYDDKLSLGRRRFYQFAFFLSLARIVVSMFRGAIAGTILAILIATFLVEKARRIRWVRSLLIFTTAVVVIGGILIATIPVVRITFNLALARRITMALKSDAGGASLQYRELETGEALREWQKSPWIGQGPGSPLSKYFKSKEFASDELYIHSAYIWFIYKMGLLGAIALLIFLIGIYTSCIQLLRRQLHPPDRGWVIGTFAAMVAMLPVIQTNNMLIRSQGAYAMTLLLFGLILIANKYRGVPRDKLPPDDPDPLSEGAETE